MPNFPGIIGRRQRIMGLGFGVLILVFGIIIGASGTFLHFKDRLTQNRWFGGPDPRRIVQDMREKLSLTEEQVKKIEDLFHQQGQTWMEYSKKIGEFQKQQWETTIAGLKSILTEEQYTAWQKDMEERRQRWDREQRERGPRGQQGPGRGGPDGQRGQGGPGGPDRSDNRRGRPDQGDRPQQGPPPGEPMPGGPMPGGPGPGPGQPMTPPPGAPAPEMAPKPAESTAPAPGSTPTKTPEEPKPL